MCHNKISYTKKKRGGNNAYKNTNKNRHRKCAIWLSQLNNLKFAMQSLINVKCQQLF